ncbi:ureidoglycolate lyase [Alteromonas gilva]|uniref:Ureidoglycolate lyase n=1 Tax=Alteromonas gilva TaxID=2987522 RepID=A0ABT5L0M0_9ALTE|nr:ureidoglycolate lyase [Alteromonas gilva]MDC8829358.1 ureidoglycolate lyase [Alteromonas gilva]
MRKTSDNAQTCIAIDHMPSLKDEGISTHKVPVKSANSPSFSRFGRKVYDYDKESVIIETWPAQGWRPVEPGTGNEAGIAEGVFEFNRRGQLMTARNHAVDGHYITGWFADPATASEQHPADCASVFVCEANYHPDGGQVFFPLQQTPFIALLAMPGDDVKPQDFIGFYCDGSFGIQIYPNIWHQPVFPLAPTAQFAGKQGKVHACIAIDFISEYNCYLQLPLHEVVLND